MNYIGPIIERRVTVTESWIQQIPLHAPTARYDALLWITIQMEMSCLMCPIKQFSPEHLESATKCRVKDHFAISDLCHTAVSGHRLQNDAWEKQGKVFSEMLQKLYSRSSVYLRLHWFGLDRAL